MVQNISRSRILFIIIVFNLISTTLTSNNIQINTVNNNFLSLMNQNNIGFDNYEINGIERPDIISNPKLDYQSITSQIGTGNNFTVKDELAVYQEDPLSLEYSNSLQDDFNIQDPATNFNVSSLQYNMTITAKQDTYDIEIGTPNKDQILSSTKIRVAQSFPVYWDYAVFYSAKLHLITTGPTLGNDEIELYLVKASGTGAPNLSDVRSVELNGPYNSSKPIPASTPSNYGYYDFTDVILEKGIYFIVIELTVVDDSNDEYNWRGRPGSGTYIYNGGTWSSVGEARCSTIELKPSESDGTTKNFIDPTEIELTDNIEGTVTSRTQLLTTTGTHILSSNTSVDIVLNNYYVFEKTFFVDSSFSVDNSTYLADSISWTLEWNSSSLNLFTYSNPQRIQYLYTPTDWNIDSFNLVANNSITIPSSRTSTGYVFDLDPLLELPKYNSGNFTFSTSSLNYLYSLNLNSNEFNLGHWTTDGVNATGFVGSPITAGIYIRDNTTADVETGTANFTLYDPNGHIVDVKNESVYQNVIFTDLTSYTNLEQSQTSPGYYEISTSFDPSINGTDLEGYWTAACLWSNGTEIGFYSIQISVSKSTSASFSWEEAVGGNMTNDTLTPIVRKNLDPVTVQVLYNNVSDLYIVSEIGKPIGAANVTYNTSWGTSGDLNYNGSHYVLNIPINVSIGDYSVTLTATGTLLETHSITFDLTVYHTFVVNNIVTHPPYYYNDTETAIHFDVVDTSSYPVELALPDEVDVYLDGTPLTLNSEYIYIQEGDGSIRLELQAGNDALNKYPGSYEINITVIKEGFFEVYGKPTTSALTTFTILEAPTQINVISADDELYYGNETTIVFNYINTISDKKITDADFEVSFDIAEAELIEQYEINGDYYITFRVLETPATSVHVFITITHDGYQPKTNLSIKSISIRNPNRGIPPFLYVIIGILGLAAILIPTIFIARRRVEGSKRSEKTLFTRIYGIYESVLSITKLIAVHKATGLPVYEMDLGSEISLDPSLITGFLTAISSMGIELRGDRAGSVKRLQYKNFYVTGSESGNFTIYTFSETELNEEIEEKLTVVSDWFAKMFSQIGEDWDGSTEVFRTNLQGITEKIMKEIHLWIFYPFIISPYKVAQVEEFNGLRKTLATYIINHENVTISRIFDELEDVKIEKGLPIIFEFIEEGILTPVFDAYKIATVRF